MRVFFGQPIDFLEKSNIQNQLREFHTRTKPLPIEVVAPYKDDLDRDLHQKPITRTEAQGIVKKDLEALESSHVLVADVSQEDRQAIGMLFEIAHAQRMNKHIIIHAGESSISKRVWIKACAHAICGTWDEVMDELHAYIGKTLTAEAGGPAAPQMAAGNGVAVAV